MTILCQPAPAPDGLIPNLGADVRSVDDLDAALRALNDDPAEDLVVVGPEADAGDALRFAAELRLERPSLLVPPYRVPRLPSPQSRSSAWDSGVLGMSFFVDNFSLPSEGISKSSS